MRLYEPDSDDDSLGGDLAKLLDEDGCHDKNYWSERYVDPKADLFPDTSVYDNCGKFDDTMDLGSDDDFLPPTDPKKFPMHVSEDDAHSLGSDKDFDAIEFADKHFAPNAMNLPKEDDLDDYLGGGGEEDSDDEIITLTKTEGESKKLIAGALKSIRSGKDKGVRLPSDEPADIGMTEVSSRKLTPMNKTNVVPTTHTPGERTEHPLVDFVATGNKVLDADEARIVRSRANLVKALKSASSEEQMEAVQEKALSEIDKVMIDINKYLRKGGKIRMNPLVESLATRFRTLEHQINEGLSAKQMVKAAEESLRIEAQVLKVLKEMKAGKSGKTTKPAREYLRIKNGEGESESDAESEGTSVSGENSATPSPIVEIAGDFDPAKTRKSYTLGNAAGAMGEVEGIPQGGNKRWTWKLNGETITFSTPTMQVERAIETIKYLPETMKKRFAMKKLKAMLHNGQIKRGEKAKKAKRGRHVKAEMEGGGAGRGEREEEDY